MVMSCYLFDNRDFLWQRDDRSRDLFGKKTRPGQPISSDNMASDRAIKGFNFKDERIVNGRWVNERHPDIIQLFFRVLAICHTAIPNVHEETGEISYEIESPDEASFVIAARELGFEFFRRTQGLTSSGGGGSSGAPADGGNSSGASRALIKDRLKTFNVQFEELHQRQSQWTVPDTELRESLRLAVAEVLLPAYRSFIKRFGNLVESGKNAQKYIRYTPEDLERMLGEFFEGKTLNEPKR